jgi:hypothetical protein
MAGMKENQFSLRRLLLSVAVIAAVIGGFSGLWRAKANARKEAVRQAIRAGRIDGEQYRGWFTEEEFAELRESTQK